MLRLWIAIKLSTNEPIHNCLYFLEVQLSKISSNNIFLKKTPTILGIAHKDYTVTKFIHPWPDSVLKPEKFYFSQEYDISVARLLTIQLLYFQTHMFSWNFISASKITLQHHPESIPFLVSPLSLQNQVSVSWISSTYIELRNGPYKHVSSFLNLFIINFILF